MALVSVKNFVTPFTNRVHLGTIIGVVVLFAVFSAADGRLSLNLPSRPSAVDRAQSSDSGKRTSTQPTKRNLPELPASLDDLDPTQELSKLGIETDTQPAATQRRATTHTQQNGVQNDDLLDSMMGKKGGAKDSQGAKDQGDLDEVERRLGLR